ncbi:MAG TPA: hypothetical protein VGH79_00190 [Gaiellaceae bacterium]|jgi:hypothetical protein
MLAATSVVILITTLAPLLGAHLAGLLSPLPVFAAVLAVFSQHTHGRAAAVAVALPALGLGAFVVATVAALGAQGLTIRAIPVQPG